MYNSYDTVKVNKKHNRYKRRKYLKVFATIILLLIVCIFLAFYYNKDSSNIDSKEKIDKFKKEINLVKPFKYSYNNIFAYNKDKLEEIIKNQGYDFSKGVPESEMVADDYFNDVVFIGDSRTEGFIMYNGLSNVKALTVKGLMVDTVFTRQAIHQNGQKLTVMEALKRTNFDKVYIMLGVNELGWAFSDIFIEKYIDIIDYIREINEEAQIYIQSILPVSYEKSSKDRIYNNTNIRNYNELIKNMTREKEVYYVDVYETIADENGNLPAEAAMDGIHLKKEYCKKWYEYLKTHTVNDQIENEEGI